MDSTQSPHTPRPSVGLGTAIALIAANMIGSGILTVSGFVARDIPNPWMILLLWLAGGVIALAGALSVAELGAMLPHAGGDYVYLHKAYGPFWGFQTGWVSFIAGFSAPIAAGAIACVEYLSYYVPALSTAQTHTLLFIHISPGHAVVIGLIIGISIFHYCGLRPGSGLQNVLTGFKITGFVAFIAAGVALGKGDWTAWQFSSFSGISSGYFSASAVSLIFIMFAYSGWNAATYIASEIRNPGQTLPKALIIGTVIVIMIYLGMNVIYFYAMPVSEAQGVIKIGAVALEKLFGADTAGLTVIVFALSISASVSAMIFVAPRVYYAMAVDGLFFSCLKQLHSTRHIPHRAIILQALWAILLALTGTFEQLLMYAGLLLVLFSAMSVGAVYRLRRIAPELHRPYRTPGYPVTPVLYVAVSVWMVLYALIQRPVEALGGAGTLLTGSMLYYWFQRKKSR